VSEIFDQLFHRVGIAEPDEGIGAERRVALDIQGIRSLAEHDAADLIGGDSESDFLST